MVKLQALQHLSRAEGTRRTTRPWEMLEPVVVHLEMETLVAMVAVLEPTVVMQRPTFVALVVEVVQGELEMASTEAQASPLP
jgi:hypothetical protein